MQRKIINKETITYLIFGVLTTIVNYGVFWIAYRFFGKESSLLANFLAFIFAVLFAYVTNKLFVFESKSWKWSVLRKEVFAFLSVRLLSFGFEECGIFLCANVLHMGEIAIWGIIGIFAAKVVLSFIVVVINYIVSKFFIFTKK